LRTTDGAIERQRKRKKTADRIIDPPFRIRLSVSYPLKTPIRFYPLIRLAIR
jgi:hypothetical protein